MRRALGVQIGYLIQMLAAPDSPSLRILERIEACGVISACSAHEAYLEAKHEVGFSNRFGPDLRRAFTNELDGWVFELSVLACIDRMLQDATPDSTRQGACCPSYLMCWSRQSIRVSTAPMSIRSLPSRTSSSGPAQSVFVVCGPSRAADGNGPYIWNVPLAGRISEVLAVTR